MRKFLILLALAAAVGLFLRFPEEESDGLQLVDVVGLTEHQVTFEDEEQDAEPPAPIEPVRGRLVRVDGTPVAGVRVLLEHAWVPQVSAVSDAEGAFQLTPSERRGKLVLEGRDLLLLGGEHTLTSSKAEGYLLVVADPVTVRGKVVDPSGAPVSGARVFAHPPSDAMVPLGIAALPVPSEDQHGFTSEDGTFELGPLPDVPRSQIEVTQQGFAPAVSPFPPDRGEVVLIVLDPA